MKLSYLTPLLLLLFSTTVIAHPVGHHTMSMEQYVQHIGQHGEFFLIIFGGIIITGLIIRHLTSGKH